MLFHQLTQLDPDYYLVLVTSEHSQRTFSNSLPPAPRWGRRPLQRSVCRLHLRSAAAFLAPGWLADGQAAASLGSGSAAAPGGPSSGHRQAAAAGLGAAGSLGC